MISLLIPRPELAPVPRMELRLASLDIVDGGGASGGTSSTLDGGGPATTGEESDGGSPALNIVTIPDGTDRVTVLRTVDGITHKVQGAVDRAYSGSLSVLDYAAPPNASSTYEIDCYGGDVSLGRVNAGSTFLPWVGRAGDVIVQNPFNPNLNAVVRNMAGSWQQISRDAPGDAVWSEGESLPTLVGFGPQRGVDALAVDFEAADRATAAKVWATLGTKESPQLRVWLIRSPNPGLMPKVFYGHVGPLAEMDRTVGRSKGARGGGVSRFRASLQETKQPAPALMVPSLRYSDLAAAFGTYSGIADALPRYQDWASAWEYAGAAG